MLDRGLSLNILLYLRSVFNGLCLFSLTLFRAVKLRNNYWGKYVVFFFCKSINIPQHQCVYVNVIFSRFIMWVIPASPNHSLLPGIYVFCNWTGEMSCCASSEFESCGVFFTKVQRVTVSFLLCFKQAFISMPG